MAENPLHAKRLPDATQETVFARFKSLASRLFSTKNESPKTDIHLTGRIQSLQDDASAVLNDLTALKEDLEKEVEADLISSIEAVVNPIIRDVHRLRRKALPTSMTEQLDTLKQYSQWIDNAKPWADFFVHNLKNRAAVIQAVVKYTIRNFAEMITRDLQVIYDYKNHKLLEFAGNENEREQVEKSIDTELAQVVKKLIALQHDIPLHSDEITLEQLEAWKKRVSQHREEYYNLSLHTIDKAIGHIAKPSINSSTESSSADQELDEHIVKNLTRLVVIEENIIPILEEITMNEPLDEELRLQMTLRLAPLENDANLLHQELQLTPELEERLQAVQMLLDEAKMRLAA